MGAAFYLIHEILLWEANHLSGPDQRRLHLTYDDLLSVFFPPWYTHSACIFDLLIMGFFSQWGLSLSLIEDTFICFVVVVWIIFLLWCFKSYYISVKGCRLSLSCSWLKVETKLGFNHMFFLCSYLRQLYLTTRHSLRLMSLWKIDNI